VAIVAIAHADHATLRRTQLFRKRRHAALDRAKLLRRHQKAVGIGECDSWRRAGTDADNAVWGGAIRWFFRATGKGCSSDAQADRGSQMDKSGSANGRPNRDRHVGFAPADYCRSNLY
jgi:hypothetical protein